MVRRVFRVIKALSDDDRRVTPDGRTALRVLRDQLRLMVRRTVLLAARPPASGIAFHVRLRASIVSLVTASIGYGMDAAAATNRPSHG